MFVECDFLTIKIDYLVANKLFYYSVYIDWCTHYLSVLICLWILIRTMHFRKFDETMLYAVVETVENHLGVIKILCDKAGPWLQNFH